MDLYLVRHADAGDASDWAGPDETRPLSTRGRKEAEALARHLARIGVTLDGVLSSPLVRAVETARAIASALSARLGEESRLEPGFSSAELAELVAQHKGGSLMLVGHNPDLQRVAQQLGGTLRLGFGKGTLMKFHLRRGSAADSELCWVLPSDAYLGQ